MFTSSSYQSAIISAAALDRSVKKALTYEIER